MILQQVFFPKSIILNLQSTDKDELFEEMLEAVVASQPDVNREEALHALHAREEKMTTGIIPGVAVPHCSIETVKGVAGAIGISRAGIDYDALDDAPVHYVFMLLCNANEDALHLKVLKELSLLLQNPGFIKELAAKTSAADVCDYICSGEAVQGTVTV